MLAEFRLHNTDCHAHYRYGIRKVYGAVTVDIGKRQVLFGNVSQIKRVAHDCDCVRNGNYAVTVNIAHDTVCSVNSGYGAVGGYVLIGSFPMAEGVALMHGRSGPELAMLSSLKTGSPHARAEWANSQSRLRERKLRK